MEILDKCSSSFFDAPDLSLVRDEGTLLRRLLSVFSLKPILVTASPIYLSPPSIVEHPQITAVPMITIRIQPNIIQGTLESIPVNLADSLSMPQVYIENKVLVKKSQNVLACRNVIFFHIPRRYHTYNIMSRFPTQININELPATVSGFETVNDREVIVPPQLTIYNESFEIKSAVVIELSCVNKNLIIGTSAFFVKRGQIDDDYYCYNPQGVLKNAASGEDNISPIKKISAGTNMSDPHEVSFFKDISTRGTIIMYTSVPKIIIPGIAVQQVVPGVVPIISGMTPTVATGPGLVIAR